MICFTNDTHFGHENIIKYCGRPFKNAQQMDEILIKNWNDRVKPEDTVYHLGDVFFSMDIAEARKIRQRLNGTVHLIKGNHDKIACSMKYDWEWIREQVLLDTPYGPVFLNHYPMRAWDRSHRGGWHLFDHVHGAYDHLFTGLSMDVGVDSNNFAPVALWEIAKRMKQIKDSKTDEEWKKVFFPATSEGEWSK